MSRPIGYLLFAPFFCSLLQCSGVADDQGPSPPLSPDDEMSTFVLEPGLSIQLVASEPMVQDPVVIAFDESNRMWVVEMRGFMPDIEGKGENEPVGRISVLEDTDGDGKMDRSTIYLDSLIMPRALAIVPGGALVAENQALWLTQDVNNDLQADSKVLIDPDYAGSALPEHAGNGLLRALDNWYYNAKSRFRYRLDSGKWKRDSTEFRGQWGISQDNTGRLYYNYNWSQLHADLVPPNYIGRNKHHTPTSGIDHGLTIDRRVYPVRSNPAVNRGYIPGTLNDEGKLIEFTAACSPFYYRGNRLPESYDGNVFVCEPAGNLVKRNITIQQGLMVSAKDPHPGREFLASTDERFRPVFITSGPDGALYIADMYRGLVQHGAYVTPYLKEQTINRKLDRPVNRGRIWRVVPDEKGEKENKPLRNLKNVSNDDLVDLLSDPNGWYRDMAQRLLVERQDTSVRESLIDAVRKGNGKWGRNHAFWSLDGLHLLDHTLLFEFLDNRDELIRIHSLQLLEQEAKNHDDVRTALQSELSRRLPAAGIKEVLQIALTAGVIPGRDVLPVLAGIALKYDTSMLIRDAVLSSIQDRESDFLTMVDQTSGWDQPSSSHEIFLEMLTTAIVRTRSEKQIRSLLARIDVDKDAFGWKEKAIVNGMAIQGRAENLKPIKLTFIPNIFRGGNPAIDTTKMTALAGIFEWPGHTIQSNDKKQFMLSGEDHKQFALGRQHYLTTCAGCHGSDGEGISRFAPPLAGSDWVLGNEKRLALILLQGLEGQVEVKGRKYGAPEILPVMPSLSTMDDEAIRAVMTYIRNEWGNHAPAIGPRLVGKTRHTHQGRVQPWTPSELNSFIEKNPNVPEMR